MMDAGDRAQAASALAELSLEELVQEIHDTIHDMAGALRQPDFHPWLVVEQLRLLQAEVERRREELDDERE